MAKPAIPPLIRPTPKSVLKKAMDLSRISSEVGRKEGAAAQVEGLTRSRERRKRR